MVLFILDHICIGKEMLKHYDIPDPFQTFVAKKYANAKGYVHDFFTGEWSYRCTTCKDDLYAPSRKIMTKIRLYHTRNECLNGY
jgi:hypothetical protein